MKYYFKFGAGLILQLVVAVIWILVISFSRNIPPVANWFIYIGFAFNLISLFYYNLKSIIVAINKEPQLEFDEVCIYDHVKNAKYYWTDIEEIEEENGSLIIKMYPVAKQISTGQILIRHAPKTIRLGNVDVYLTELLTMLNIYSIKAIKMEK
ncbi:hypothetical protein ACFGVS_07350 [Mucilaginibacter sp. AW1-7]|jgi:hypothetical protein|uniref:hypothetical protein n=1 Tax=unclassified Mucilaginibacter TaxID=2617802 RepID=UPI002365830B|nr:hypothetical protein [Mucilaginibacter sp. KACC 22773]WDF80411.1 hypothetical protein PQ469_10375 [Mucilaginibacter sp. KACC 22773]